MADDVTNHPATFRNGVLSIYQSAVEDLAHRAEGRQMTPGKRPGMDTHTSAGGPAAAASHAENATGPDPQAAVAGVGIPDKIGHCADLGLKFLMAHAHGDSAAASKIKDQIQFSQCDPNWIGT